MITPLVLIGVVAFLASSFALARQFAAPDGRLRHAVERLSAAWVWVKARYEESNDKIDIVIYGASGTAAGRAITIISLTRVRPFVSDAVFQTIFLYASIVTEIQYPEPAKTLNDMLAIFSLQLFNVVPPECADPDATFYTKLVIMTSVPLIVPLLIWLYLTLHQARPGREPQGLRDVDPIPRAHPRRRDIGVVSNFRLRQV